MTMDAMIVYLEDRGFKATRKYGFKVEEKEIEDEQT